MHTLTHYRLCPRSRSLRIAFAELDFPVRLVEQEPWAIGPSFLAVNPAGEIPILTLDNGPVLCGVYAASEYVCCDRIDGGKSQGPALSLFANEPIDRAEVRRLVDWFQNKLDREVTRELLHEKLYTRMSGATAFGPNPEVLRVARSNLKYHLSYVSYLADQRPWLAGDELTFADISAAAHVSVLDYLSEVHWDKYPVAKSWYQRIKSRPAFRALLTDRVAGMPPSEQYADLDF